MDESLHGRVAILPSDAYSVLPSSKSAKSELQYPTTLQTGEPTLLNSPSLSMPSEASSVVNSPNLNGNSQLSTNGVNNSENSISNAETIIASVQETRRKNEEILKEKEVERVKKWNKMLIVKSRDEGLNVLKYGFLHLKSKSISLEGVSGSRSSSGEEKLRRRIYKGIPDPWRSAAWGALIERLNHLGDLEELEELKMNPKPSKSTLEKIKKRRRDEISRYKRLLERSSPHDVQIDLDVPRTISGHISFHTRYGKGQRSLFHLLHCFSLFCKDCGYCQGMGPIAATLLCYLTEEVSYDFLCSLHGRVPSVHLPSSPAIPSNPDHNEDVNLNLDVDTSTSTSTSRGGIGLHETFQPGFPGVVENFFVQESLVSIYLPNLSEKFKSEGISTSAYATRWYITLFANSIPFETQLRLWDVLLFEGKDFLVVFSLAILWGLRDRLSRKDFSFEKCLEMLSSYIVPENDDLLLNWCKEVLGRNEIRKQIRDIRKEWKGLVKSGEAMSRLT